MPDPAPRFVALDVQKHYVVVGAVDALQTLLLSPRRVSLAQFPEWAKRHLQPTDQIVGDNERQHLDALRSACSPGQSGRGG